MDFDNFINILCQILISGDFFLIYASCNVLFIQIIFEKSFISLIVYVFSKRGILNDAFVTSRTFHPTTFGRIPRCIMCIAPIHAVAFLIVGQIALRATSTHIKITLQNPVCSMRIAPTFALFWSCCRVEH